MYSLPLSNYAAEIKLFEPYKVDLDFSKSNKETMVGVLLEELNKEALALAQGRLPNDYSGKRRLLRAVLNTLPARRLRNSHIELLNQLLYTELEEKNIQDVTGIKVYRKAGNTKIGLWQGDITCLQTDAIVNAANAQMLGCFQPLHGCIDNAIHSAAGVQLRDDCSKIIDIQGHLEATATAKITRAYNLPSHFVLHTVGPIVQGQLRESHVDQLAQCYTSCLTLANEMDIVKSIGFCCISTGVFGYPQYEAAQVAIRTVIDWLDNQVHGFEHIVFNVFLDTDFRIYQELLNEL